MTIKKGMNFNTEFLVRAAPQPKLVRFEPGFLPY